MTPASTHILFDLHGTIIDGVAPHPCYSAAYGELMAARYGKSPEVWTRANWRIVADWDSYYTDLDLGGENGIADMWEGYFPRDAGTRAALVIRSGSTRQKYKPPI